MPLQAFEMRSEDSGMLTIRPEEHIKRKQTVDDTVSPKKAQMNTLVGSPTTSLNKASSKKLKLPPLDPKKIASKSYLNSRRFTQTHPAPKKPVHTLFQQ